MNEYFESLLLKLYFRFRLLSGYRDCILLNIFDLNLGQNKSSLKKLRRK